MSAGQREGRGEDFRATLYHTCEETQKDCRRIANVAKRSERKEREKKKKEIRLLQEMVRVGKGEMTGDK